tara:strand:- start:597 stop:926 length:330 start_codon:yes stop_codon:yes gene_type:complete
MLIFDGVCNFVREFFNPADEVSKNKKKKLKCHKKKIKKIWNNHATMREISIGDTRKILNQIWKYHKTIKSNSAVTVPLHFARLKKKWTAGEFALKYIIQLHLKRKKKIT